jgi:hypothetical protein
MSVDEMCVDMMSLDKMSVDEMPIDEMSCHRKLKSQLLWLQNVSNMLYIKVHYHWRNGGSKNASDSIYGATLTVSITIRMRQPA